MRIQWGKQLQYRVGCSRQRRVSPGCSGRGCVRTLSAGSSPQAPQDSLSLGRLCMGLLPPRIVKDKTTPHVLAVAGQSKAIPGRTWSNLPAQATTVYNKMCTGGVLDNLSFTHTCVLPLPGSFVGLTGLEKRLQPNSGCSLVACKMRGSTKKQKDCKMAALLQSIHHPSCHKRRQHRVTIWRCSQATR